MKSATSGKLALMSAVKQLMDEVMAGPAEREEREGPLADAYALLASAKKLVLFAAGVATQRYMQQLADQQEVMAEIANMVIELYAMESGVLRADKIAGKGGAEIATAMSQIYCETAMDRLEISARRIVAAAAEGDMMRTQMTILRRIAKHDPADTIRLRRQVAQHVIRAGRYSL
jgi:butyryl-CoA dehydrogenase